MTKSKKNKKVNWKRLSGTTNFYPTYVEGNLDKVTPTSATFKTDFQKVIPRYDLSMTQTRDKGTGPTFLETSYQKPKNNSTRRINFGSPGEANGFELVSPELKSTFHINGDSQGNQPASNYDDDNITFNWDSSFLSFDPDEDNYRLIITKQSAKHIFLAVSLHF